MRCLGMLTNRTKLYPIQEMQIEKRMEKLKKGRAKDSQSKLKVKACLLVTKCSYPFCIDTVNISGLKNHFVTYLIQEEAEKSALERIKQALMDGKPARSVSLTDFEKEAVNHLCLLTMKPVIYVANVAESDVAQPESNPQVKEVMNTASELQSGVVTISAQVAPLPPPHPKKK